MLAKNRTVEALVLSDNQIGDDGCQALFDVMPQNSSVTELNLGANAISNDGCAAYSPITWQVDRTCHMISAASFDNMCKMMKEVADDMSADLVPHGSRELVNDTWTTATVVRRNLHAADKRM